MPGFHIKFTNSFPLGSGFAAMATRPWSISIRPGYLTAPDPRAGILLFAHELVHLKQGADLAFSILGEVLAYQAQSALRPHLYGGSANTRHEKDANTIDLSNPFALRNDYYLWSRMKNKLIWWENRHPGYKIDPIFPLINNPFPQPLRLPVSVPPHGGLFP
jgi:hypothetical protein